MTFTARSTITAMLALTTAVGVARAQVVALTSEELAEYQGRLPGAIQSTNVAAFKTYLQGLQRRQAAAGTAEAKAGLAREIANAVRVADGLRTTPAATGTFFSHYAVPSMSPLMRLPDAYPVDGKIGGEVAIVAAQDEYEPASFVVHPYIDAGKVELAVSDLKSADGTVFSKTNLDLKVVKVWYQNGNGWFSYFSDVDLTLVPELLVYDENLIRVDTKERSNYARVSTPTGTKQVWISAPRKIDVPFDSYAEGFADAKTLQPVAFNAGQFKQFFLTAHVPADAKPGLYKGSIQVTAAGQPPVQIPVSLKVLPFALPLPKANYDVKKDFIVSLMGAWPRVDANHKAFMPTLRNLRRHNILHLGPNVGPSSPPPVAEANVKAMKEAGFETKPIINGNLPWVGQHDGTPLTYDELMTLQRSAKAWRAFYLKHFGHTDAVIGLGDEQGAAWVMKTRPAWRILNEQGLKSNLAGHDHIFAKGGYMLDFHPTAGSPGEKDKAATWRAVGHGNVGFYASQHNGAENPDFVRRQHGLLGYLSDFDMVDNYEFAYGPWNDLAYDLYKPMVLAYPTSEGLVDTLAWEGFREGIDDIRYATKLRQLAEEAIASGNLDRVYAGRQVRQWFALMDGTTVDLSTVRLEIIERIERLMQLAKDNK